MENTKNNIDKKDSFFSLIDKTFTRVLKKGFHGSVGFKVCIKDGAIQEIEKEELEKYR